MTLKSYKNYKTSVSKFLQAIPSHWEEAPLKWHIQRNDGGAWGEDPSGGELDVLVLRSTEQTVDGKWCIEEPAKRSLSKSEKEETLLEEGDLLVTKSSGSKQHIGKTTIVTKNIAELECCYSNFMQRLRLRNSLEPKLGWYLLNNEITREQFNFLSNSTTGLANINATTIGNIYVPVPPAQEQGLIVNFLNRETAKIGTLIAEQERLIELLQEKRQAIISHAVTKGLNPDAPMKRSGVDWLGQVPEHWEITRLKFVKSKQKNAFVDGPFGSNLKSEHYVEDGEVLVIESGFATTGKLNESDLKRISEQHFATISRSEALEGDIIIAKIGARYGMSSILPRVSSRAVISGNSLKLTVDHEKLNIEYSHYFLLVLKACGAMDEDVNVTAQPALSLGGLNNIIFLRPPLNEQTFIVDEINKQCGKLDSLITTAYAMAETLSERRAALISAAVTGQIDVRGLVPEVEVAA
tara:strand:+ start:364 stop:1761 length:1398 start_codon:yes stop_codon:yes gene_type:complete